jgi:hypothetical protein
VKIQKNLDNFWSLKGNSFGMARSMEFFHIEQLVRDRLALSHGIDLLNDEMHFAPSPVGADFSQACMLTTLAHTMCGDRIQQANTRNAYALAVGSRFGTRTRKGEPKFERFFPAGGGVNDGTTLAHVTYAHAIDAPIKKKLYEGNPESVVLLNFDLQGHFGRHDDHGKVIYGKAAESPFREPRAACGAIVGCIAHYNEKNLDHKRIRATLGEENYNILNQGIKAEGMDITPIVAAAIVTISGVNETVNGIMQELSGHDDESKKRTLAHFTGSLTENRIAMNDLAIYLIRATYFQGQVKRQGFGTEAKKYGAKLVDYAGDKRLVLTYGGMSLDEFPVETHTN